MIRGSIERLALLCAAAGITSAEWEDFTAEVRQTGAAEAKKLYNKIRHQVRSIQSIGDQEDVEHNGNLELTTSNVIRDITRLIDDADIPTSTAARHLSLEIQLDHPELNSDAFRFNSKEGLRRWLQRLIRAFGESYILSAASRTFRERLSDPDWRLR